MALDLAVIEPVAVQMTFDYDSLDSDIREEVRDLIGQGHLHLRRTKEEIIAFGKVLHKVKKLVPHGQFRALTTAEYGLPDSTITYAMKKASDSENANVDILPENAVDQPVEQVEEATEVRKIRTTNEEKRKTVEDFIAETPNWQEMSNREIARVCGVDEKTVRNIRKELEPESTPEPEQEVTPPLVESIAPVDNMPTDVDNLSAPEPESTEKKEEEPRVSSVPAALLSSESNEWYTPKIYIDAAHELMGGIELDPASSEIANKTVKAADFYDISRNGLNESWKGRVWLNPPYGKENGKSNQETWTKKLLKEIELGHVEEAILLVNSSTGASWFQPLTDHLICFTDHRIRFYNADSDQPTKENALVYFGTQRKRFIEIFSRFGTVMERAR